MEQDQLPNASGRWATASCLLLDIEGRESVCVCMIISPTSIFI